MLFRSALLRNFNLRDILLGWKLNNMLNILYVVFPPLLFVFNNCYNLLSNVIMKFGFEITQLRVSPNPFLAFCQFKMDAYDA